MSDGDTKEDRSSSKAMILADSGPREGDPQRRTVKLIVRIFRFEFDGIFGGSKLDNLEIFRKNK